MKLVKWCSERNIRIIVDESFVDFAEEEDATLIDEEIINRYPNLIILKSISKSYGIPGIRLGILVSADEKMISDMKKDVAIWNINSFGEFYMQIEEKYKKDYALALNKIKDVRRQFVRELSKISWIRVIPSQANYLLIEITGGISAKELTKILLLEYNILIKDLSNKILKEGKQA